MSRESDRLLEVASLIGQRLNGVVKDVVPPEAHEHLLNSLLIIDYEHTSC